MGFFSRNKKAGRPPHEWYPEILHWKDGDVVNCWSLMKAFGRAKVTSEDLRRYIYSQKPNAVTLSARFKYKSVDARGMVYLEHEGDLVEFEFWRLISCAENETLKSRKVGERMKESAKYMELMEHFQQAYDELQEQDRIDSGELTPPDKLKS